MLDRIQASLSALPPAEQRVGKLVVADARKFVNMPISEIADRSHVSKPTVVRFCRSMGYDGLSDFKLKMAGTVSEGVPFIHRSVDSDDKISDVLVKVIDNSVAAFLRYRNDASTHALERAVAALEAAWKEDRRIEFYGVGNSGIVAQDAQHKFFRLGVNAIAYSDGHMQVMSASLRKPGDVVVVLTASGSPLASVGNIHLAADHPENYDRYSPMTSRLLHLMIVDVLATALALRIGADQLQPLLKDMKSNLHSRRYA